MWHNTLWEETKNLDYGEQSSSKRNLRNTDTVIVTEFKLTLLTQDRPINQETNCWDKK